MAEAFLQVVLDNLNSMIQKELGLLWGVDKEMEKLSSILSTVQSVLEDAEEKQVRDQAIRNWLGKLKDAAYDADDVLDEFATETSRQQWKSQRSAVRFFGLKNIMFRHRIGNRMKDVVQRLDEIAEERTKFHLREITFSERKVEVIENRQTGSIITQPVVFGREEDTEKIVQYLICDAVASDLSIYPIVGMGGLGKTTFAQLVFNDERVRNHFELRIWVCVSEDFDVKRVIKAIIESATGNACEDLDLDPLQRRLQGTLSTKRYLIVLDDVWNDDQEKWDRLKYVLTCGSEGSSIVVTTRLDKVASIVGTVPAYRLSGLSEDDCWSLFKERAFGVDTAPERPNLVVIGKEIVKKCGGVPLAVKALGSLMRFKKEETQWLHVKESELWNLPQDENSILPTLRLSYFNLPMKLRQCFAYCAIFPKDSEIDKEILIHLWMANGFISSDGNLEMEDIGNEICNELHLRSLFQDVKKDELGNIQKFGMHDLVHDLAQSVAGGECHVSGPGGLTSSSRRIRHLGVPYSKQSFTFPDDLYKIESLRTLHLQKIIPFYRDNAFFKFSCDISKFRYLRAFIASDSGLTKLSSSILCMKHLRYLDLSHTKIKVLPESICSLWNLQILKLDWCLNLQRLPNRIRLLRNLRHLFFDGSVSYLPPKIGELSSLQTLTAFIVGRKRGCYLSELKRLNLKGELRIKHLERVGNPVEAKEANLNEKENLNRLRLIWDHNNGSESSEHAEKVLEFLEPHPNLQFLQIRGYAGVVFPHWMHESVLYNLTSFALSDCKNCIQLPPLSKLPFLSNLWLEKMNSVQYLDDENQWGPTRFPSLKSLCVTDCPELLRLTRDERREQVLHLNRLHVDNCPRLSLPCLVSLKDLYIRGCTETLFKSISNLSSLDSLCVSENSDLTSFPVGMLQKLTALGVLSLQRIPNLKVLPDDLVGVNSLATLLVKGCHELECLPEKGLRNLNSLRIIEIADCRKFKSLSEGIRHLTSLESLVIKNCPELAALPEEIKHLVSLRNLSLYNQPNLASLPHSFGNLTSLSSLEIYDCAKLTYLPVGIKNLANLNLLRIVKCPELVKRCEKPTGEDWFKISHIPSIYLDNTTMSVADCRVLCFQNLSTQRSQIIDQMPCLLS
ncbi:putative disease resistance protein RGA3 [Mercurialis annua]|uniref:putative disease resistance protein RGA3 n=1 Tax=Mercurialis annua TaxID=3986 RepID=UPI002160AAD7|nr:putative disease resistance protein RGA3 [Mercurialis annua]